MQVVWYNAFMFVKVTKSGKYEYVQLVSSYRENGAVKHKVLLNLGRLDQIENNESIKRLAIRLQELSGVKGKVDLSKSSEAEIINWGYVVYRKIWQEFGLDRILCRIKEESGVHFDLPSACFLMAVQHLLEPESKLKTYCHQGRYINLPEVELHHLYRSLDVLCEYKEELEERLFYQHRHLFNMKVDVVFYDVTTFYFESVREDNLRGFGFSKDGKFKEVQVVLGLLVDCEGRPIGYELFPGDTFEGQTLELFLEKLKRRLSLRKVIIVADRGINSKLNLKRIADKGYSYIFASRIKRLPRKVEEQALASDGFTKPDKEGFHYKVLDYINEVKVDGHAHNLKEKLIITYSPSRASKDRAERNRFIAKAMSLLEDRSRIKASQKRGGRKYLQELGGKDSDWVLDEEAIARDEKFDGYYGLQTNEQELDAYEILEAYHTLWKIEESFRIMKSTLEVRPIFHWTESRIKGHFAICFLAFLLERTLEFSLKKSGEPASPEEIRFSLNSMNFAQVEVENKHFLIKTKGTEVGNKILRLLKIRPPKNVTPLEELSL